MLKSGIENGTEVLLNLSSKLIRSSNDETSFPHKLSLTDTQVSKIRKGFANCSSAYIKFAKNLLSKMIQSGGILDELLASLPYTAIKAESQELIKSPELPELNRSATKCCRSIRIIGRNISSRCRNLKESL